MTEPQLRSARSGAELRRQLLDDFALETSAQIALLDTACAAFEQALEAEKLIKKQGLVVLGARGPVPNPAVMIGKDARNRLMRALRALDLKP